MSSHSQAHYDAVTASSGDAGALDKYDTISSTVSPSRDACVSTSKGQPQAFSDKTGKPDTRGAYGLHGQEMIAWLHISAHAARISGCRHLGRKDR